MGFPVKRINSLIWALSAAVATIAGVLLSPVSLVDPSIGFLGIKAFAAAVVGGFGSLIGTVFGGLIVGVSETLPRWLSLTFLATALAVLVAPKMT
jgi:branched-chain amino acid transport system permease protein